jgi:hypothetical protein
MYYAGNKIIGELVGLLLYFVLSLIRLKLLSMGNKTENSGLIVGGLIFSPLILISYIYYLRLQVYVLVYEVIINTIGIVILGLEALLALYAIISISSNEKKF